MLMEEARRAIAAYGRQMCGQGLSRGTSGNLSLNVLFERATAQLGQLRAGDLEGARQAMAGVTEAYTNAVEAIRAVYGEG